MRFPLPASALLTAMLASVAAAAQFETAPANVEWGAYARNLIVPGNDVARKHEPQDNISFAAWGRHSCLPDSVV